MRPTSASKPLTAWTVLAADFLGGSVAVARGVVGPIGVAVALPPPLLLLSPPFPPAALLVAVPLAEELKPAEAADEEDGEEPNTIVDEP